MAYFSAIVTLAYWLPSASNLAIIVHAFLFGFGSGAFILLISASLGQISNVREIGIRTGLLFAISSFGALTGDPIGGALLSLHHHDGSFHRPQIFAGVTMIAGATFLLGARVYLAKLAVVKNCDRGPMDIVYDLVFP